VSDDDRPVSPAQRGALLNLKAQVEQATAAHEAVGAAAEQLTRAQRGMGRALNGLLQAITQVLRTQDEAEDQPAAVLVEPYRPPSAAELLADDLSRHPRGHPCRNCGRYFDEHRPRRNGDGDMHCEEWR